MHQLHFKSSSSKHLIWSLFNCSLWILMTHGEWILKSSIGHCWSGPFCANLHRRVTRAEKGSQDTDTQAVGERHPRSESWIQSPMLHKVFAPWAPWRVSIGLWASPGNWGDPARLPGERRFLSLRLACIRCFKMRLAPQHSRAAEPSLPSLG